MNIEIKKVKDHPVLRAYVKIYIGNLWISDIKVIEKNGLFVSFPKEKKKDKYYPIVGISDKKAKADFCEEILKCYRNN